VTGLNGDYGISGSVYVDPVAHRLTFYLGDSGGYASFANWDVHVAFPNLPGNEQITSLAFDFASTNYPLRYVGVSSSFTGNSVDLIFNGTPSTVGVFAYPFLYDGTTTVASGAPEPTLWALMILGIGGMGGALRSRRRPHSRGIARCE